MKPLPSSYVARFAALRKEAEEGPFGISLRALFRGRPIANSRLSEFELAMYVDQILVWRKTAVGLAEDKAAKMDDLLGQALVEAVLFGLFIKARQAQSLADDYPSTSPSNGYLCPVRLSMAPADGEVGDEGI